MLTKLTDRMPINTEKAVNVAGESVSEHSRFRRFQQIFIIFFVFSIFGHYIEVAWAIVLQVFCGSRWFPVLADILPLAAPYGLGAVALILFVWPLMKKYNHYPIRIFALSVFVTGVVEFLCALLLVILYGKNYFWDYSNKFLNLFGFICLQNCLLFGIASMLFLYFVYPHFQKFSGKFSRRQVSVCFWVLLFMYVINMVAVCIREFF